MILILNFLNVFFGEIAGNGMREKGDNSQQRGCGPDLMQES